MHCLNGFAYSAVTTLYMAFYVDSLAPDENRNHAMGYYVGSLALGYSTGNFFGGLIADHWGYSWTFQLGASVVAGFAVALLWFLHSPSGRRQSQWKRKEAAKLSVQRILQGSAGAGLGHRGLVALFLNLLHQMGGVFISLYGLAVGMTLTQIGIIRAGYAGSMR